METDIPLTDLFRCPFCGFRGLFKAEPAARVKCICGGRWAIGDLNHFISLTDEEVEMITLWDVNVYGDQKEANGNWFNEREARS